MVYNNLASFLCRFERRKITEKSFSLWKLFSKKPNFPHSTLAFSIFFYFCAMKNNFLLAFMLVLLVLAGCTGKGNHSDESIGSSQPKDTLYTAKTVMSIYALQPERALQIIDSAELLGNLTTIKADYLRALVYSRSIESMQYDSAILIAERLMENDKVLADDKLEEEVLEVLLYACRMDQDYVNLIHHSDRGCQYASGGYVRLLAANGIHVSMTESGDPKENA